MLQCTNFIVVKVEILQLTAIRVNLGYSTANMSGCTGNNNRLLRLLIPFTKTCHMKKTVTAYACVHIGNVYSYY